jgi:nucleoside-diphosphate-sugar epimerase
MVSLGLTFQSEHMAETSAAVALTGATGFLGQHIQRTLVNAGYPLRCLNRSANAAIVPGAESQLTNVGSIPSLIAALANTRAVIYLAGTVRGTTPDDFQPANVDGVANIAHVLAEHYPDTPLLLMSSIAATAPTLSDYAASKAAGECAVRHSRHQHWTIFRAPAVYGDGDRELRSTFNTMRHGLVPIAGPEHQRLPFIEVTDLAAAVTCWVKNTSACNQQTYAIDDGAESGYDWPTIARLIAPERHLAIPIPYPLLHALGSVNLALAKIAGYAPMLTPGKARELTHVGWACDNAAFTNATGWRPQLGLGAGVERMFSQ